MDILDNVELSDPRVAFAEVKPAGWAGYISATKLYAALDEQGVPPELWPNRVTDGKCLQRSFEDCRPKGKRWMTRPLSKGKGWANVLENPSALDLEWIEEMRRCGATEEELAEYASASSVKITGKVERALTDAGLSTLRITPEDHPMVPQLKDTYAYHRGTGDADLGMFKCSEDLSVWFSQTIIPWVKAVATRGRGGTYYVLRSHFAQIQAVQAALESVSSYKHEEIKELPNGKKIYRTTVTFGGRLLMKAELPTIAAVEILVNSVITTCEKKLDILDEKLREGTFGGRALSTKAEDVDKYGAFLKEFEDELSFSLDTMRERIAESEAGVGMAQLKLQAEKDALAEKEVAA